MGEIFILLQTKMDWLYVSALCPWVLAYGIIWFNVCLLSDLDAHIETSVNIYVALETRVELILIDRIYMN